MRNEKWEPWHTSLVDFEVEVEDQIFESCLVSTDWTTIPFDWKSEPSSTSHVTIPYLFVNSPIDNKCAFYDLLDKE